MGRAVCVRSTRVLRGARWRLAHGDRRRRGLRPGRKARRLARVARPSLRASRLLRARAAQPWRVRRGWRGHALHLPPEGLCADVVLLDSLATQPCRLRGLVVAAERAQLTSEHRRVSGEETKLPAGFEPLADVRQPPARVLVVIGERGDLGHDPIANPATGLFAVARIRLLGERPGVVEAAEHGEKPCAAEGRHRRRRLLQPLEHRQRLVRWPRPGGKGRLEKRDVRRLPAAGKPSVAERLLARPRHVLESRASVRDPEAEDVPDMRQPSVVSRLFEQRQRSERECLEFIRRSRCQLPSIEAGDRAGKGLSGRIVCGRRPLRCLLGDRCRLLRIGQERLGEVELQVDVETQRPRQLERPREQPGRRAIIGAPKGPPTGGGQSITGTQRESRVGLPELISVADGLLQVVADEFVELDEVATAIFEPGREAGVQVGTDTLGERFVGGVADKQVAEAVAVVACELGAVGVDELPSDEGGEPDRDLRFFGCQRLDGAAMEDLALHRAALEHPALGFVELVEAHRQQRPERGRHVHLYMVGRHREHLRDEQRSADRLAGRRPRSPAGSPTARRRRRRGCPRRRAP